MRYLRLLEGNKGGPLGELCLCVCGTVLLEMIWMCCFLETAARKEDCPTVTTNPKVSKLVMLCIQALRYLEP